MQLESVLFKHVGMFRDLTIEFQPTQRPITLILGEQATGKTTILKNADSNPKCNTFVIS